MQAQKKRTLREGREYDGLIARADGKNKTVRKQAGVADTLKLVREVVLSTLPQTERLAAKLLGKSVNDTCRNNWEFVYQHIQYALDDPGVEQVRRPARSWADRVKGVDCEDYAVFLSSLLLNQGIAHKLRISAYQGTWQHIYVVVPRPGVDVHREQLDRDEYYALDCVTDRYDYEVPPSKTQDHIMELDLLSGLAGLPATPANHHHIVASYLTDEGELMGIDGLGNPYLHVEDDDALAGLAGAGRGPGGRFKPLAKAQQALRRTFSRRKLPGTPVLDHTAPNALPAGEPAIVATYETESGHTVGLDGLGALYVYDEQPLSFAEMAAGGHLNGLADTELHGIFKPLKKVVQAAKKGVDATFKVANKIPGVKALADTVGKTALSTGLSLVSGGTLNADKLKSGLSLVNNLTSSAPKSTPAPTPAPVTTQLVATVVPAVTPASTPASTPQVSKATVVKAVPTTAKKAAKKVAAPAKVVGKAKPASKIKAPVSLKPKAGAPVVTHRERPTVKQKAPVETQPQPVQQVAQPAPLPAAVPLAVDTPLPTAAVAPLPSAYTASLAQPFASSLMATESLPEQSLVSDTAAAAVSTLPAVVAPTPSAALPFYQSPLAIGGAAVAAVGLLALVLRKPTAAPAARPLAGLPTRKAASKRAKKPAAPKGVGRVKLS